MQSLRPQRIALYARFSSDLQNPSSVEDQVALCRRLIETQVGGTDPGGAVVFSDAAITGATMERPGMLRLLAAVKAKRIDLVVAEGLDRLSRSLKDIAAIHEILGYHGVSIWTAHEGRISELHIGFKGTMNALFLRDMKAKVRRGQSARIAAGYATSSCPYGYRVVRGVVDEKGRNVNGVREIDENTASVVRRIYGEFAEGRKIPDIIAGLNRDNVPAPGGGLWKRNALAGSPKKQEGVLYNEIYIGNLIYNRTRVVRDPVTGRRRYIVNPEEDWIRTNVPELRIVGDDLWQSVQSLLRDKPPARAECKKRLPEILNTHNQHALTGWVKCGWCGGPKSLANASRYLCSTHRYAKKCRNSRGTKEPVLMAAVFQALYDRIQNGPDFRPRLLQAFARESRRKEALSEREAEIKARIGRLVAALERGVSEESVTDRIRALEDEVAQVRREIQSDVPPDLPDEASIRAALALGVRAIEVAGDVTRARSAFKCVLDAIVLTPIAGKTCGETLAVSLREDGWPEFWRQAGE